jgi:hypothetical protein
MESKKKVTGATGDRAKTATALRYAMLRVKNTGRRISIKAVAEEAKVDPSLVHHVYPDIAEEIRAISGRDSRAQRDKKHVELVQARLRVRDLTDDVATLLAELTEIASLNLALESELQDVRAQLARNVRALRIE